MDDVLEDTIKTLKKTREDLQNLLNHHDNDIEEVQVKQSDDLETVDMQKDGNILSICFIVDSQNDRRAERRNS